MLRSRPQALRNSLILAFLTLLGNLLTRISVVKPFKTVETEKVHVDAHGRIRMTGSKANTMPT
jgi:hypothetical protein